MRRADTPARAGRCAAGPGQDGPPDWRRVRGRRLARRDARKAQAATPKLKTRLSKGEKRNRKRLAEVGAVYDLTPVPRHPTDVMGGEKTREKTREKTGQPSTPEPVPVAKNKWVTASIVDNAAQVLRDA